MNKTRIAELRQEHGWTQERLATESRVGLRTVQRLEAGEDASRETLSLVADALRVPVRELFTMIEDPDLGGRVESLQVRTGEQQAARDRLTGAWRWLCIGIGVVLTLVGFTLGQYGQVLFLAFWTGGYLILMAIRRIYVEPRLEEIPTLPQQETTARTTDKVSQGCRGEALSGAFFVDPVPDARALEGPSNNSGESHSADDSGTVHEDKRIADSGFQLFNLARQDPSLIGGGEERLRTCRLPWSKMFAVSFLGIENWSNVSLGEQSKSGIV